MGPDELCAVVRSSSPKRTALPAVLSDLGFVEVGRGRESAVYRSVDGDYVVKCFVPLSRGRAVDEHALLEELCRSGSPRQLASGRHLRYPRPLALVAEQGVLVEEFVEGTTLEEWMLTASAAEADEVADDLLQAAELSFVALGHKYGDFNPWNVLLAEDSLVLLDPGLPSESTFQVGRHPGVIDDIGFWVQQVASNAHRLVRTSGSLSAHFVFASTLLAKYMARHDRSRRGTVRRLRLVARIVRSVLALQLASTRRRPRVRDLFFLAEGGLVSLAIGLSATRRVVSG